ncbi:N-acetylneuraminate synthase family protein, partial [Enterobacter cancerogenus]|uniref:N-acetylneuraminate synthase family protein n=1 Tax=Enterobacter cancerogenus TaxID=69218 RepID=UPI001F3BA6EC
MTLIIAEAGVNHNGNEKLAFDLVDAAHKAGADIVKFQTFKAKNLVTEQAKQADYQVANTQRQESQLDMLSRLELSWETHHALIKHCNELGIEFLSTAFDSESLNFLVNELGIKRLKLPSGELTNAPLVGGGGGGGGVGFFFVVFEDETRNSHTGRRVCVFGVG